MALSAVLGALERAKVCFVKRFIAQEVYIGCSRTSYKIVPLTNLNKYLHNDTSKTEVNINTRANSDSEILI